MKIPRAHHVGLAACDDPDCPGLHLTACDEHDRPMVEMILAVEDMKQMLTYMQDVLYAKAASRE
jgi:hypothetical protein